MAYSTKEDYMEGYWILYEMSDKKGDEGHKTNYHEERPSGYTGCLPGLRYQDV
jgi:hypothetical protein